MGLSWMPRLVDEYLKHVLGSRVLLYFPCEALNAFLRAARRARLWIETAFENLREKSQLELSSCGWTMGGDIENENEKRQVENVNKEKNPLCM